MPADLSPAARLYVDLINHQLELARVEEGDVQQLLRVLERADAELLERVRGLVERGRSPDTIAHYEEVRRQVRTAYAAAYQRFGGELDEVFRAEVERTGENVARSLSGVIESNKLAKPDWGAVASVASQKPFHGALMKEHVEKLEANHRQGVANALAVGLASGDDVDGLVRRIRGTQRNGFKDGVLQLPRYRAEALARTTIHVASSEGRRALYAENDDLVKGVRAWVTLDEDTCKFCGPRDGKVWVFQGALDDVREGPAPVAEKAYIPGVAPAPLVRGQRGEPGFVYHATNAERLDEIAADGTLRTHRPGEFTDQDAWPDGSTERRAYFGASPEELWQFAPEEGTAVLLRMARPKKMKGDGTGDLYVTKPVKAGDLEYRGADDHWHPLAERVARAEADADAARLAAAREAEATALAAAQAAREAERLAAEAAAKAAELGPPWAPLPAHPDPAEVEARFPRAGDRVDGRVVRKGVPNEGSIDATYSGTDYVELPGIREVSAADMWDPEYKPESTARIRELAEKIKESGEISPLIMTLDETGTLSVLEGGHRYDALHLLGARSVPAKIVIEEGVLRRAAELTTEERIRANIWAGLEGANSGTPRELVDYFFDAGEFDGGWEEVLRQIDSYLRDVDPAEIARPFSAGALQEVVEKAVAEAHIFSRTTIPGLAKILEDGRLKSQHETRTSRGQYDPAFRRRLEAAVFGEWSDVQKAPIYGYLSEDRNGVSWSSGVDGYGSVAVKFKPTVRERTSWVGDDSFWLASAPDVIEDGTGRLVFLPSSVAKPSAASLGKKDAIHFFRRREGDAPFSPSRTSSYWEAQVHGGVTLDDIDEVIFYHRNEFEMWSPKLREAGIRHRFDPYQETVQHSKHAMGTEKLLAEVERDRAVFDAEFERVGGAYLPRVINGKIEDQRQSQIDAALADFREADTPDRFVKLSSLDPKLAKEALEEKVRAYTEKYERGGRGKTAEELRVAMKEAERTPYESGVARIEAFRRLIARQEAEADSVIREHLRSDLHNLTAENMAALARLSEDAAARLRRDLDIYAEADRADGASMTIDELAAAARDGEFGDGSLRKKAVMEFVAERREAKKAFQRASLDAELTENGLELTREAFATWKRQDRVEAEAYWEEEVVEWARREANKAIDDVDRAGYGKVANAETWLARAKGQRNVVNEARLTAVSSQMKAKAQQRFERASAEQFNNLNQAALDRIGGLSQEWGEKTYIALRKTTEQDKALVNALSAEQIEDWIGKGSFGAEGSLRRQAMQNVRSERLAEVSKLLGDIHLKIQTTAESAWKEVERLGGPKILAQERAKWDKVVEATAKHYLETQDDSFIEDLLEVLDSKPERGIFAVRLRQGWEEAKAKKRADAIYREASPVPAYRVLGEDQGWKRVGTQMGSNEGGLYETATGERWYVKFYGDPARISEELAAARLYRALGIRTPETQSAVIGGRRGIASRWIDGAQTSTPEVLAGLDGVHGGFVADAWLANWDVVGLGYDNLLVDTNLNVAFRLDLGGALRWRARGEPKGAAWSAVEVRELETLLDANLNATSQRVFRGVPQADVLRQIDHLQKTMTDDLIRSIVESVPGVSDPEGLILALRGRRDFLVRYAEQVRQKTSQEFASFWAADYYEATAKGGGSRGTWAYRRYEIEHGENLGWVGSLNDAEKRYLNEYTGSLYEGLNRFLRGNPPTLGSGVYGSAVKAMDAALSRSSLPVDTVTWRRAEGWIGRWEDLKPGEIINDRGYVSTTVDPPALFSNQPIFKIYVRAGMRGAAPVWKVSEFDHEAEIILGRGSRFRVVKAERYQGEAKGRPVIELEWLGPGTPSAGI